MKKVTRKKIFKEEKMKNFLLSKLNNKKVIIVSIMIMLTCVLTLSYASFVVTTSDYKASELLVSELSYSLTIYEDGSSVPIENNNIIIGAKETKKYNVVITSINKIDSKYSLAYNSQEDLTVKYSKIGRASCRERV